MKKSILTIVALGLSITSCAIIERQNERDRMQQILNRQMGILSYDKALSTWGSPISITQGDEIFIALWGSENSSYVVVPTKTFIYGGTISHGWQLQLTFSKYSKRMTNWSFKNW